VRREAAAAGRERVLGFFEGNGESEAYIRGGDGAVNGFGLAWFCAVRVRGCLENVPDFFLFGVGGACYY
jgi:hypothetical protein